jgi:NitT/TauT family transport system substrate-binding protein
MGYVADVEDYAFEYALHEGLYAAQGLDVKLIPGGQGVDQVQEVVAGVAQVGVDGAEQIIQAVGKGQMLKVFASEFQKSPVAMTCRKDSGVTVPSQLKGKTVGVKPTVGQLLSLFLTKNSLSAGDIHQVPIGGSDISEIIAGKVQCEFTTFAFNEPKEIQDQGVPVNVIPLADYGLPAQEDAFFVTQSFFNDPAHQATLVKFLKVTNQAWMNMFHDPAGAAKYEVGHNFVDGLDLNQQIFQSQQQVLYMKSDLTASVGMMAVDPAAWVQTANNLFASKITSSVVPTADWLTNDLLKKSDPPKL